MGGRIAVLALALTGCTPTAAESSEPPPGASPVEPPKSPAIAPDDDCPDVVDFDEHLATLTVPAADVLAVREQLDEDDRNSVSRPEELAKIFGKRMTDPLTALVPLLTDYELGDGAAATMFAIDRDRAAPIVFASMPKSDRNVQYHSFKLFLRLALGGQPICWNAVVSDAARRTLTQGTSADAAEQALLALGMSGLPSDAALLQRYLDSDQGVDYWETRLRNAAQAALGRLGDETTIDAIRRELDVPIAKRITFDRAIELAAAMDKAGFSRQRSLVPLLCRHLASPSAVPDSDALPPSPREHAARALAHILDNAHLDEVRVDVEAWKQRCAAL